VNRWINMLFYQATWLAAVAGAGAGRWWPGLVVLLAFAIWQLSTSPWPRADAVLMASVSALGFGIDSAFVQNGLMHFATPGPLPGLAPIWMVSLWTSFALALNHSLAFLQQRVVLASALGCFGASLAYWAAGHGWHALTFGEPPLRSIALIAAVWAVLMPLLAQLALRWRRFDAPAPLAAAGGGG
jgi:hypothetical protein